MATQESQLLAAVRGGGAGELTALGSPLLRRALPALLFVLVTAALFPTLQALWPLWTSLHESHYAHGPLVLCISLYLVIRAAANGPLPARSAPYMLLVVLVLVAMLWALGKLASTRTFYEALWPVALWLVFAIVYGWRESRQFWIPIGLLYFALPIWTPLTDYVLQPATVSIAPKLVALFGVPASVQGNLVTIPAGVFEIEAACGGGHYFLVATLTGALIAYLDAPRWRQRVALIAAAAGGAMVVNWLRVASIILVGQWTDMTGYLVTVDHYWYGWVLFAVFIVAFALAVRRFLPAAPVRQHEAVAPIAASGAAIAGRLIASVAVLALGTAVAHAASLRTLTSGPQGTVELPRISHDWSGPDVAAGAVWRPQFTGARAESLARYESLGARIEVYLNIYASQSEGRELVNSNNTIVDAGWHQDSVRRVRVRFGRSWVSAMEIVATDEQRSRWLLRYVYVGDRFVTASGLESKLRLASSLLAQRPAPQGIFVTAIRCAENCDVERASTDSLWLAIGDGIRGEFTTKIAGKPLAEVSP